jgi:hypothetical protein
LTFICLASLITARHLWVIANTTTNEEAAAYCGGHPECYPEVLFMYGVLFFGIVGASSSYLLFIVVGPDVLMSYLKSHGFRN